MREQFAHRRLGFAPETVTQWMAASGLEPVMHKSLSPEPGPDGKIAVSLWLARDSRALMVSPAAGRGVMNSPTRASRIERGDGRRISCRSNSSRPTARRWTRSCGSRSSAWRRSRRTSYR